MRKLTVILLLVVCTAWAAPETQPNNGAPEDQQQYQAPKTVLCVYDIRDYVKGFPNYPLHPAPLRKPTTRPAPPDQNSNTGPGIAAIGQGDQIGSAQDRIDGLIRLIESVATPDSWRDVGGSAGSITELDGKLYVTQTPETQAKVAAIVADATADKDRTVYVSAEWLELTDADLAALREHPAKGDDEAIIRLSASALQKVTPMARARLDCLDGQAAHVVTGAGRRNIMLQVQPWISASGNAVVVDVTNVIPGAEEFHTTASIPVASDVVIGGITADAGANNPAKQLFLVIRLELAGSAAPPEKPAVTGLRVYDIRNYLRDVSDYPLVPTPTRRPPPIVNVEPTGVSVVYQPDATDSRQKKNYFLNRLIESTIAPDSWRDEGGSVGSILDLDGKLYVIQTPDVQTRVAKLVAGASADADRPVNIRAEWLALTSAELAVMRDPAAGDDAGIRVGEQALLKATPMSRAHLLCLDGQTVHITMGAARIGLQIQPRVSADGKHVILDVLNRIDTGPEFHTTARIPIGENIVIGGITAERPARDQSKQLYLVIRVDAGQ